MKWRHRDEGVGWLAALNDRYSCRALSLFQSRPADLGPLQALNPHSIWFLVILVMALGAFGHVATRALGARFGLPIAGLASGFVSSTATIGAMAGRAAKEPASMTAAVAGAAFSTVATFVQLALLLLTITRPTLVLMAPALGAGACVAALYGLAFALRAVTVEGTADAKPGRAFSVGAALGLAAMMRPSCWFSPRP